MRSVLLGLRLLRRDWRAGELAVLVFALLLAVAASTAVGMFSERLQRALVEQAAELLGADLVVASHQPLPAEWWQQADALGLRKTQVLEFPSMAVVGEQFLLVSVKAVEQGYPLRGALRTALAEVGPDAPADGIPAMGEAWVDARVLTELGIALDGEEIPSLRRDVTSNVPLPPVRQYRVELGQLHLKITRLLTHEPDRRPDFYSLSPRLLMNAADLPASALIQPGSRVHYHGLFAGQNRAAFRNWLQTRLNTGQRLLDVDQERPDLGNALARAERYLGLTAAVVALLSGVAVAVATRRYARRHYDTVAMLRCLGAQRREVRLIVASQLLVAGLLAASLGVIFGWLAQEGLLFMLQALLPIAPSAFGFGQALWGAGSGLLVLAGFAWPALLQLERLTPLRVLRRDLEPPSPSAWLVGLAMLAVAALLVWPYAGDGVTAALLLTSIAVLVLVVAGLAWSLLVLSLSWRPADLSWRFALRNLNHHPGRSLAQTVAFAIALAAMAVSLVVRNDLLDDWRNRLDAQAPNYFLVNLFEADRARLEQKLANAGVGSSRLYPVVRGRLTQINGRPAQSFADKDSQGEQALNRELNLTWTAELPVGNHILVGEWGTPGVSLEQKLAESLHLSVGDKLTFSIADRPLEATVSSLRALRWDSMTPNFYAIFPPGVLQDFPYSYLTSFYVSSERRAVLTGLVREFPSVTLLDVDQLLRQVQTVLKQVTLAVDSVLVFALAAGVAVLWATVLTQVEERLQEDALLRALGAERRLLRRSRRLEFALLGALAGLLAVIVAEALVWALYRQVLHMAFAFHGRLWLGLPVLGALLVAVCGLALTRRAVLLSPLTVLRES